MAAQRATSRAGSTGSAIGAVDLAAARRWWHRRQGLDRQPGRSVAETIADTGWLRTLGGIDAYLAAAARVPGLRRIGLESAVAAGELRVVPAVRGCIYLVPARDAGLALALADELDWPRTWRELERAGVEPAELERAAAAALGVLDGGPAVPDAIRRQLPPGALRSLGEAGKKVGVTSVLPSALRRLEFDGLIERALPDGRLDSERYIWRRTAAAPAVPDRVHAEVVRRFLRFAGPVSLRHLAEWSGLSRAACRAALAEVGAVAVSVADYADEAWLAAADANELLGGAPPVPRDGSSPASFLAFEDNYLVLHGGPGLLADPRHHGQLVESWGRSEPVPLGEARHLSSRSIVLGDRLAGWWEHDIEAGRVVWTTFDEPTASERAALEAGAQATAELIADLGHARSFSLDTDAAVRSRAVRVRSGRPTAGR